MQINGIVCLRDESADASSNDTFDTSTPQRKLSDKTRNIIKQRQEIKKNYLELQKKLQQELESKKAEWVKLRPELQTCAGQDEPVKLSHKSAPASPRVKEDLPEDFKKKLEEWRAKPVNKKEPEPVKEVPKKTEKKADWDAWKRGEAVVPQLGVLPDVKDLSEDFQKKISEWKQFKAEGKLHSGSSPHSTTGDGFKRYSYKKAFIKPATFVTNTVRKSKTADDIELKAKLKALVSLEPPKKEVVVQTTKGEVLKFAGISKKFTKKLYEWEKEKNTKPEASTYALLHPGYIPVKLDLNREMKREKSPGLQRSISVDSISPNVSHPSLVHQPSSLSLNDAEELKDDKPDVTARRVSSNPELDMTSNETEPEAVIVEVEDIGECASPLDNRSISGNEAAEEINSDIWNILATIEAVKYCSNLPPRANDLSKTVRQMRANLDALIDCLPRMSAFMTQRTVPVKLIKQLASEIIGLLDSIDDHTEMKLDRVNFINGRLTGLQEILDKVSLRRVLNRDDSRSPTEESIPEISVTPDYGAHATQVIVSTVPNKATVSVTKTFVCDDTKIVKPERKSSDLDVESGASQPQSSSLESERHERKLQRNLSTGSRRKVRLKRMGSRQNSKTEESDSEEETVHVVLETPKKVKRKTSKCKKVAEEKPVVTDTQTDEVVVVLKIKPTQPVEDVTFDFKSTPTPSSDQTKIILTPCEVNTSEIIKNPVAIVSTRRKRFTPIATGSTGEILAVAGVDVDSSSPSETKNADTSSPEKDEQVVKKLPPLPQSPSTHRRRVEYQKSSSKELSPNIKLMIAKYNDEVAKTSKSPTPTGSCSPVAWRSPVADRRVKQQTVTYQEQVGLLAKSSSNNSLRGGKELQSPKLSVRKTAPLAADEDDDSRDDEVYETVLSYDCLKRKLDKRREVEKDSVDDVAKLAQELEKCLLQQRAMDQSKGAIRKIPDYGRSTSLVDKPVNTAPKITRRNEPNSRPILETSISCTSTEPEMKVTAPRSPLSQRAEKIRKAKEEFLRTNQEPRVATQKRNNWANRLSQISSLSTESADDLIVQKSASSGAIQEPTYDVHFSVSGQSLTASTNETKDAVSTTSTTSKETATKPSDSKLGFLTSKLRKVKLRRNSKDLNKSGAISALCRQSLVADITGQSTKADKSNSSSRNSLNNSENVKKSSSHIFGRFFRPSKERLRKSRSLGLLNQAPEVLKRKESN